MTALSPRRLARPVVIGWLLSGLAGCMAMPDGRPLPTSAPMAVLPTTAVTMPATHQLPPSPAPLATSTASMPATETPVLALLPATPSPAVTVDMGRQTADPAPLEPAATITPPHASTVIGYSREGRPIEAFRFGTGPRPVIFVGGIHGGYEWNTIVLAYEAIRYFDAHPEAVPANVTLHIIPAANPDGQVRVTRREGVFGPGDVISDTVPGRFNSRGVDLNRNWDCQWQETAVWRDQVVSGGAAPFSEPETVALRDYFVQLDPALVLFWHSAANGVFASGCPDTHTPSLALAQIYGQAAGYPVYERFTSYEITGDAGDWLSSKGVPSISVELRNHESIDWPQNLAGMLALMRHFGA